MDDATAFTDSNVQRPRILGGWFRPLQHPQAAMAVAVFAERLYIGGAQLFVRVGRQRVDNVIPIPGGRGFTGTLRRAPQEGERLFLQYVGRLEESTDVVYHANAGREPVA